MKKFVVVGFLFPLSIAIYPQDYLINFAGTGGSTSVESVKIENLTQGTHLTVNGMDMLNLKAVLTGINNGYTTTEKSLYVYPNPVTECATINFIAPAPGNALIAVYDQVGKTIVQTLTNLAEGTHTYQINGLSCGFYTVRVASETYSYTGKIISLQKSMATAGITCNGITESIKNDDKLKSANATIQMQYTGGDRLKFTGISGNYSTILTDIPTESKIIAFDFLACTDGDNNHYPVVKIGAQMWMAENLKTTKYNDGTAIPLVTDDAEWMGLSTPACCWYNNDEAAYKATYGALYNWYAVSTTNNSSKNVCPSGWHVPGDDEWTILTDYLGGDSVAGGKIKETGTTHWYSPNTGATNETGFTALPGGFRSYNNGGSNNAGYFGLWWSSSENAASDAWGRDSRYNGGGVLRSPYSKLNGFSVRCVRDEDGSAPVAAFAASNISISAGESVAFTDQSTNNPTGWNWDFGDGGTSAEQSPSHTYSTAGTYTVGLTATNSYGSGSDIKTNYITVTAGGGSTVTDYEGNIYSTVIIGTQEWMAENLKTTKYNDGTAIPNVTDTAEWSALITPAYCWYSNDEAANKSTYGALYNWHTINTGSLCPMGWHVPADAEWTTLENYLIANGYNYDNTTTEDKTAKALASASGWSSSSEAGVVGNTDYPAKRNVTGFSALPGGFRGFNGTSYYIGDIGYWWSATESNTLSAWNRGLGYENGNLGRGTYSKEGGISVRCVRDENGSAPVAAFTASETSISEGESIAFTDQSTNNPTGWNWDFGDGGTSTQQNPSYIFSTAGIFTVGLTATNSYGSGSETKINYITVSAGGGTVTDFDGNVYNTIAIGTQTWMQENLKTTHYANGTAIPLVTGTSNWEALTITSEAYCWYGDDINNKATYGALYTWPAAMNGVPSSSSNPSGIQGVCPVGWHLPSHEEWAQLTDYLGGESVAGGKLKETGTVHWYSTNTAATNESDFTALPGGQRGNDGTFQSIGYYGNWWSATEYDTGSALNRRMFHGDSNVYIIIDSKEVGFSVRCLRD